jgi:chromosome segregation ATPase
MILIVFFGVVAAVCLVAFEFAEDIANFKTGMGNLKSLYDAAMANNSYLERDINKVSAECNMVKKQLGDMQEKESEFITRIFEQRKEIDSKNEENRSLIEAGKNFQARVVELEKYVEIMRKQQEKSIVEFKKIKEERAALEEELKEANKRKKTAVMAS